MVATEVMKEYLVRLGFDIDSPAQARVRQALKELENTLTSLSKNQATNVLIKGMSAYVGAIAAAITATAGLMHKVAEMDMEYQKVALHMHMSTETAKQLTIAQKALGASLDEIVWNPELRSHYQELRHLVQEAGPPADAEKRFKMIREVGFEFTKLKVVAGQVIENIAYQLVDVLGGAMEETKQTLANIRKWIVENMPAISRKIAEFLGHVVSVGQSVVFVVKGVYSGIKSVVEIIPEAARGITVLLSALALGLKLNPALVAIGAFFLLIEDYYKWSRAQDLGLDPDKYSAFGGMWGSLNKTFDSLTESLKSLKEAFSGIDGDLLKIGLWQSFGYALKVAASMISTVAMGLTTIMSTIDYLGRKKALKDKIYMETAWELAQLDKDKKDKKITDKEYKEKVSELDRKSKRLISDVETSSLDEYLTKMNTHVRDYLDTGKKTMFGSYADNYNDTPQTKKVIDRASANAVIPKNAPQVPVAQAPTAYTGTAPTYIDPIEAKTFGVTENQRNMINAAKQTGMINVYDIHLGQANFYIKDKNSEIYKALSDKAKTYSETKGTNVPK